MELAYRNNRQYEWPVEMGIATREEVELATFDELEMFNYQADKKFELMQGMDRKNSEVKKYGNQAHDNRY
ncbi:hypothetical protein AZI10_04835 [Levilactobacillus brevis]|nr:hypothetical protein AZI10_04835 [Levilactobacillus brevis]